MSTLRRTLDRLYATAAVAAALAMLGILLMVLAGVVGRLIGFNLPGSDAYAGYCTAAAAFLALAPTLKRGEHIRVTMLIGRAGPRLAYLLELSGRGLGVVICAGLAVYACRLVWYSWLFGDVSQSSDATPLWIPQLAMAGGATLLAIAMLDELWLHLRGQPAASDSAARIGPGSRRQAD